ncbi:hypothetical protein BGX27_001778 [Mortierella sp. AM989]|nr:hypothetical protein BGX27_001778 [Mortierella sp. AM989]
MEYQKQRHYDQDLGLPQPSQSDNAASRRKRSFHFEPEFIAALDASLHENQSFPKPRPTKRPKRSTSATTTTTTTNPIPTISAATTATTPARTRSTSPSSPKASEGVSIIDLSSGEELASFHLGENEHKRRRESIPDSSSSESLREVFDVHEDGSLHTVTEHAPVKPSPIKRIRTRKSDESSLEILDELEGVAYKDIRRMRGQPSYTGSKWINTRMNNYRDTQSSQMEQDGWMSDDEASNKSKKSNSRAELGALIRYEGPKTMTLADGVDALIREHWSNTNGDFPSLSSSQGNELVLYRRPLPTFLSSQDVDDDEPQQSSSRIVELDDDDDINASVDMFDNSDSRINELEEKIMYMDID